jgi:hypothetical protein
MQDSSPPQAEAVKKWDWLRADVGVLQEFRVAARCLSQFFHSLTVFSTSIEAFLEKPMCLA